MNKSDTLSILYKRINKLQAENKLMFNALKTISEKGTSCHFIAIAKEAISSVHEVINILHTRKCTDDNSLDVQLFEVINAEKPYRIRLIDRQTGEVGPQIRMYESLGDAAKFYERNSPIW